MSTAPTVPSHFTQLEGNRNSNAATNVNAKRNELWLFNLPSNLTVSDLEDIDFQLPTNDPVEAIQANLPQHLKCLTIQSQQYCLYAEDSTLARNIVPLACDSDNTTDYVPTLPIQRTFKVVAQLHPCTYNNKYNQQQLQPAADFKLPTPKYAPTANPMFLPPAQIKMVGQFKPVGYVGQEEVHKVGYRRGIEHLKRQMAPKTAQLLSPTKRVKKEKSHKDNGEDGSERKSSKKHRADADGSSKKSKKHKSKDQ